jgi:hypothetical protein
MPVSPRRCAGGYDSRDRGDDTTAVVHTGLRFGEAWRVLAYALALALGFVLLGRAQIAVFTAPLTQRGLQQFGLLHGASDAQLARQAQTIAAASREAAERAPPGHRLDTLRLGYELGFASERVAFFAMSSTAERARARALLAPRQAAADALAAKLGVAPAPMLQSANLREFNELSARFEADQNGVAARVQQQLSPWHRHVYLLGVHIGIESARIEATGGEHSLPPAALIRRHATLAGIEPALWQPLAAEPNVEVPEQRTQRYRAAVQVLAAALAQQDPLDTGTSSR